MFVHSRELAILAIIILLAAAGSQLPRLVRAFGESPRRTVHDAESAADDADDEQAGSAP